MVESSSLARNFFNLTYFLSIEVARSRHGIFLSQRKYVLDLLKETRMLGCKDVDNPAEPNKKLGERHENPLVDTNDWSPMQLM
jgi:hypothetical protein